MNSVPNSDSEQCTESKLSRVHKVHTLAQPACTAPCHRPGLAVSQAWLGRVVGCIVAQSAVSWPTMRAPVARPGQPPHFFTPFFFPFHTMWPTFFLSHHFFYISATEKPQFFFFHFLVNQINLLKFILSIFFPVLHTVKP